MNSLNTIRRINQQAVAARTAAPAPTARAVVLHRNPNTGSYTPIYQPQPVANKQLEFYAAAVAAHCANS